MDRLDSIIHQPVRLRIMAILSKIGNDEEADFSYLKRLLDVTDGNLGSHLSKLEQAGYVEIQKEFVHRKPRTYIRASGAGRDAFDAHVKALRLIVDSQTKKGG